MADLDTFEGIVSIEIEKHDTHCFMSEETFIYAGTYNLKFG